jgi:large subunit ribosomal protein L10
LNRTEKNEQIQQIQEALNAAESVFLVDMTGLKVNDITEFRRRIKAASGACRVVKNRLASRASKGSRAEVLEDRFQGPIGMVTHPSDPITVAKVLAEFSKDYPALQLRVAAVDGRLAEADEMAALAALPGFNELRAMLLGVLSAPASKLVRLMATPASQLARTLDAKKEKMDESS